MDNYLLSENKVVEKPWGRYTDFIRTNNQVLKQIELNAGQRFSLQYHDFREEHWICTYGTGIAILDGREFELKPGTYIYVPRRAVHRAINTGDTVLMINETQLGLCMEDDIVRTEDDYGRSSA